MATKRTAPTKKTGSTRKTTSTKKASSTRKTTSTKKATISKKLTNAGKTKDRVHVIPQQGRWAVRKEGGKRAVVVSSDKKAAVSRARDLVMSGSTSVAIVHKKDGTISGRVGIKKPASKKSTGGRKSAKR